MGAGSLMAPVLISVFSVSAVAAVGTDLLYSAGTKLVGGARHLSLRTVNVEIALWMAAGSVPASVLGVLALNRLAASQGAAIQSDMKDVIGIGLMLVAITVAVRTFVTVRGMWDASVPPTSSIAFLMIGSQITVALPEKALRGSLASVLALPSLKMLGAF